MVHLRLNEKEHNPNPHINFITALPTLKSEDQETARQFLRALAAQVRPIMKSHGFEVNSLEEYEFNTVFSGRNWNNGETIELVLRTKDGRFSNTSYLMGTLCHEIAHIKHMNHGPAFQALWKQLRFEVHQLQAKGYFGDGYWSSGKGLKDSNYVPGQGMSLGEMPEYICGGAQSRSRPTARRRTRTQASNRTGAQTDKKRKPGRRVTSKFAFPGEGISLSDIDPKGKESSFRKQAGSKRAREERALAVERRLQVLQTPEASTSHTPDEDDLSAKEEEVKETDEERRKTLLESEVDDLQNLKSGSWNDYFSDFIFANDTVEVKSSTTVPVASTSKTQSTPTSNPIGIGKLAQTEINFRKEESPGLLPVKAKRALRSDIQWACQVCTLLNESQHLACSACATPRGERNM